MPAILSAVIDPETEQPRSRMFWVLLGALALGQLLAFWLLCSHQVRKAEARNTEQTVHQMALADCLQYIPGSTIASCSTRIVGAPAGRSANASLAGAMPVSFVTTHR